MTMPNTTDDLVGLVRELCKLPSETEWVEFKHGNEEPEAIGEYLSALANAAALAGKSSAYMLWGIEDATHRVVGTSFQPSQRKVGNQELESWLLQLLEPKIHFQFHSVPVDGLAVVVLEIGAAFRHPVRFKGQEFIRVGSYKKKLKDVPEKERILWRVFDQQPFEDGLAAQRVSSGEVLSRLDHPAYFRLVERPLPEKEQGVLQAFQDEELIQPADSGGWNITNLGAVLFARNLNDFPSLRRKTVRVIRYRGAGRVETMREQVEEKGYACGFEGLIRDVNGLFPSNEVIGQALRRTVPRFPPLAVRELVANALIHQDFSVTGAGPMVEVFDNRVEITNPGEPLIDAKRFVDSPPKSRNETLASLMRRFGICEERGSGVDKVVDQVEQFHLPAPLFEVPEGFTRTVLFAHRPLREMDKADRVRACYLHACLKYVQRDYLTNASIRTRFGIKPENKAMASRYIREAVAEQAIKPFDEHAARNLMKYLPFWA